jgi:peptidoglycan/xylan/chitin deacetylase (PgdA/CDA1 family)
MVGRMLIKHSMKHAAGLAAVAATPFTKREQSTACVLMYHRIADTGIFDLELDDWNLAPARLDQQLRWLSENAECVPLAEALQRCASDTRRKPVVALTFDDGFANFRQEALPLLERYGIPATLFVVTAYVGLTDPYPFDSWGQKNRYRTPAIAWRPISWEEIEKSLDSKLVSVGSHSHRHLNGLNASDEQLAEEAGVSYEILGNRLGPAHSSLYAYPYGSSRLGHVRTTYIAAVRNAGYRHAVTTDLGLARAATPPFQIPRVEVHAWDSSHILKAKVYGRLAPQQFCDRFRRAQRQSIR